jgi:hypothetical protein
MSPKISTKILKFCLSSTLIIGLIISGWPFQVHLAHAANTKIRQELNIINGYLGAASGSFATSSAIVNLDSTKFTSGTYYFEVVASTTSATNATVSLINATSSAIIKSITVNGTAYALYRSTSFTAPGIATDYTVKVGNEAVGKGIIAARLVVLQDAATFSNTQTQIEIGNEETYTSSATTTFASPKSWYYDSSKWNGSQTFYAEVTYNNVAEPSGFIATTSIALIEYNPAIGDGFQASTATTTIVGNGTAASSTSMTTAATYTYKATQRASKVIVELWGGGGAGGQRTSIGATGGGAGGAYARSVIASPVGNHTIVVGAAGVSSTAVNGLKSTYDSTTVVAAGASTTAINVITGSLAAPSSSSTGQVISTGGNGFDGVAGTSGGGGGGSGGPFAAGNSASGSTGATAVTGGGNGGNGKTGGQGVGSAPTTPPGGGGGGAYRTSAATSAGGAGSAGQAKLTETVPVRVRVPFTPTNGRNYRLAFNNGYNGATFAIYNAKIVVEQSSPLQLETQYLLANTQIAAGTALQTFLTSWTSTEWTTTNTYLHEVNSNAGSSVVEVDTAGGTQVTGSSVTASAKRSVSSAMTMPSNGNLDMKATTNNGDVYASKILVQVDTRTVAGAPTSLTATGRNGKVSLTWTTPASNGGAAITGYNLYRDIAPNAAVLIGNLGVVTSYDDGAITGGTLYYYRVTAVNAIGESTYSNESSATPTTATSSVGQSRINLSGKILRLIGGRVWFK